LTSSYFNYFTSYINLLIWGKKKNEELRPIRKHENGTIDWGTPGNRPREKPAEYY
jgi:hypothetical protein